MADEPTTSEGRALLALLNHVAAFECIGFSTSLPPAPGISKSLSEFSRVEIATARLALRAIKEALGLETPNEP